MNQDYKKRMEEREIDLMDLIYYISMHWRSILIAAIVGMVALGAYSFITSQQNEEKAKLATIESMKKDLMEEYETDGKYDTEQKRKDRLALVETIAEQIKAYDVLIDAQNEYLNGSIFARENVTDVHCRNLQYLITVDSNNMTYLDSLVDAYSGIIQSDEVYEKVADKTGREVEKQFVAECFLIDEKPVEKEDDKTQSSVDVNVVKVFNSSDNYTKEDNGEINSKTVATILNISAMGPTDEFVDAIAKVIDDVVNSSKDGLCSNVVDHFISKVSDNAYSKYTNDFAMKKSDAVGIVKAKMDDKVKMSAVLTDTEISYAEMIVDEVRIKENDQEGQAASKVSKKMIVLGFVVGLILLVGIWAIAYLLSGRVMCARALERIVGVHTYSVKRESTKQSVIDGWLTSSLDTTKYLSIDTIGELLVVDIMKANVKNVAVVGYSAGELANTIVDCISKQLGEVDFYVCKDIVNDPKTKRELISRDAIILIENVNKIKYQDVCEELLEGENKKIVACVAFR